MKYQKVDDTVIAKTNEETLKKLFSLSADDLDNLAKEGKTLLGPLYFTTDFLEAKELTGGWVCKFVGLKEEGIKGHLVLFPRADWTRGIWAEGQINHAINHGLSPEQAQRWYDSKVTTKHALLEPLVKIISRNRSDELRECLNYTPDLTGDALAKWQARSGITESMHPKRIMSLIELIKDVYEGCSDSPILIGKQDRPINNRPWEF